MQKGFAIKICNYLVTERSNDVFRDPESGIQQVFFVVCYLLQSSVKEERLLAYRTLECFPRKEFLDSDLALLLGETLLRDSMDSDPLIASNGIKGIFMHSRNIDYSASYIKSWLCHPASIIRESCLVGLLDLMSRYHYGVELQYERKVSHDLSKNFWASFVPFVPLIESFCFDETENNREVEILREKSFQILELCPLLLDPTTDST